MAFLVLLTIFHTHPFLIGGIIVGAFILYGACSDDYLQG